MSVDYDVITVGGGLGAAALGKTLGENGVRVAILERERKFSDRVRGEFLVPWGCAEAVKLGLYDRLLATCGNQQPLWSMNGVIRDLAKTTPQALPAISFCHPEMQEVVLDSAHQAGASVRRGVTVRQVTPGKVPTVAVEDGSHTRELTARIVVCADGRTSLGRTWGGFTVHSDRPRLYICGVMLTHVTMPPDTTMFTINLAQQLVALLAPQRDGRARAYFGYPATMTPRLQGESHLGRFIDGCVTAGIPRKCYEGARAIGPLASFDGTATWVNHPFRRNVALLGDAAGASDPTWGQGLAATLRDARVLSASLLSSDDWEGAGCAYALSRDNYFRQALKLEEWLSGLFFDRGPEADARRERALPRLAAEPDRYPDHHMSGPDLPSDEHVRRRLFGEE